MLTENEQNLINCLEGSSRFMTKIIDEGLLDEPQHGVLKMFMLSQIESNNMTVRHVQKAEDTKSGV